MDTQSCIVLGTHNRKKGLELEVLLLPFGFRVQTLADYPDALKVDETGTTFADNARLKATEQARHLGRWVIGEDSGLEVDALRGAPGVLSARYAGADASDEKNNIHLLSCAAQCGMCRAHRTLRLPHLSGRPRWQCAA